MLANETEIPQWAKWAACDANGAWWAFEAEPHLSSQSWYENEVGRFMKINIRNPTEHWQLSLRKL
ncbi:MAG: hypothetical protein JKY93_05715 [Gammaproteobacteria bacterium]|nr:hypothetical protein [Gammaproteobacteria bacterium]